MRPTTKQPQAEQPATCVDWYDALTLDIERADALAVHLATRLSDLSEGEPAELYALSLIAGDISEKHDRIHEKARALFNRHDEPGQTITGVGSDRMVIPGQSREQRREALAVLDEVITHLQAEAEKRRAAEKGGTRIQKGAAVRRTTGGRS
jgi:hypothetical protein